MLGHMITVYIFEELPDFFLESSCTILLSHLYEDSNFPTSSPTVVIISLFCYSHPSGYEVYLIMVLVCISLMISNVEHLFLCLLTIYLYIFFGEMSIQILWSFKNWVMCLDIKSYKNSFPELSC